MKGYAQHNQPKPMRGRHTLLVRIKRCDVTLLEVKLRDISLGARGVPSLCKGERFAGESSIVNHLHRELHTFPVEPFLQCL